VRTPGQAVAPGQAAAIRRALDLQANERHSVPAITAGSAFDATIPIDTKALQTALANDGGRPAGGGPLEADTPAAAKPKHSRSAVPFRLRTTVGVSALLAAAAGVALVLTTGPVSGPPLAPSALPTSTNGALAGSQPSSTHRAARPPASPSPDKSAAQSASPAPSPSRSPSSPSPSTTPSPSPKPSATASQVPPGSVPATMTSPAFTTLTVGATEPEAEIADVQSRLLKLHLLFSRNGGATYKFRGYPTPDAAGTYGQATQDAISAFQTLQGLLQGPCTQQTYNALLQATGN
jgi:hypothetical protein